MSFNLRFSVMSGLCMLLLLAAFVPIVIAADSSPGTVANIPDWLKEHFAIVALVISEGMSFLPSKAAGIIKGSLSLFELWFKKKPSYSSGLKRH